MKSLSSAGSTKCPIRCCVLILGVAILALVLRLPRLQQRPIHTDEAVHAIKFGKLLEEGSYTYNPIEFHGPTLNYLTLIPAWLSSTKKLIDASEWTLRIVPVFFGVLLVLLPLLIVNGLGTSSAIYAAILIAISPAMVFYSRYYIQEMLLVCFTFSAIACGYRYTQSKNLIWALLTGMSIGLMHATKETSIIAFGSMLLALSFVLLMRKRNGGLKPTLRNFVKCRVGLAPPWHCIVMVATAAIVSALFYSSFFTNPGGILDSFRTYATYFDRATTNSLHFHPWYYYLKMLIYSRYAAGPIWSEALIVCLAVVGFIAVMMKKGLPCGNVHLLRFIAFYTLIMTVVYSVIPYKTPWCMLSFLHGMILLAAVGAVALVKLVPKFLPRLIVVLLLFVASVHLTWQAYLANYKYCADPRNPYVYAHTTADVFTMVQRVEEIAEVHPRLRGDKLAPADAGDGNKMEIHFICPDEHDFWPFPWYLRSFPNVGYWNTVTDSVVSASVIIASPSVEQELLTKLYELPPPGQKRLYVPLFDTYMELRPQIELRGYVPKDLWDRFQQHQTQSIQSQKTDEK